MDPYGFDPYEPLWLETPMDPYGFDPYGLLCLRPLWNRMA